MRIRWSIIRFILVLYCCGLSVNGNLLCGGFWMCSFRMCF